jgi:hypothetical protein
MFHMATPDQVRGRLSPFQGEVRRERSVAERRSTRHARNVLA